MVEEGQSQCELPYSFLLLSMKEESKANVGSRRMLVRSGGEWCQAGQGEALLPSSTLIPYNPHLPDSLPSSLPGMHGNILAPTPGVLVVEELLPPLAQTHLVLHTSGLLSWCGRG